MEVNVAVEVLRPGDSASAPWGGVCQPACPAARPAGSPRTGGPLARL